MPENEKNIIPEEVDGGARNPAIIFSQAIMGR
jgi:hypothetical protein